MLFRFLPLLLLSLFSLSLQAQKGQLSGKVLNEKNEELPGVTVRVNEGGGSLTNADGHFSLALPAGKKYLLTFTAIGYQPKTVADVIVVAGETRELNVVLAADTKSLEVVTVSASASRARRESVASLIQYQKTTNTVASVLSAESIRRSPDRNTAEALKRLPGASLQEGRFIIVRGLADRYNQAMLNGILLTSTEPDRKTFSLDLIPSAMIDNLVVNKAFVPELPGEWAGGLIQVTTKDIPANNFLNIQVGTGFNLQTAGRPFFRDRGGKLDWLGLDDGTRSLPSGYTTKSAFDALSPAQKTTLGKRLRDNWTPLETAAPVNVSFAANGGFRARVFGRKGGGMFGVLYNKSNRYQQLLNQSNGAVNGVFSVNNRFADDKYVQEVSLGALGSFSLQLAGADRISLKALVNVNAPNSVTRRQGADFTRQEDLQGTEATFKQNTFFTTQLSGDHSLPSKVKLKWYGAFSILDAYNPDQRRILYAKSAGSADPYKLLIANSLSQQSGSRIFQMLNDYIYTTGGDLTRTFTLFGRQQTAKGGYMFQLKDRLYDGQFYANYLRVNNDSIRLLPPSRVFASENFGNGEDNRIGFDAIKNKNFRYMANTILNAGFLQLDNHFTPDLRVVWGVRVEHYDQLVGSRNKNDSRHTYSRVLDVLPGLNATYKLDARTNLRLSGSQTVIRPELRELSALNIYDFELNASVSGNPSLRRSRISNLDLRYELYPRTGETLSAGVFYKYFRNPIEQYFDEAAGGASTFTYINTEKATAFGIETELRKRLDVAPVLKNFTLVANASYIHSRVKSRTYDVDRPLQGQSPYVLNLGLLYDLPKKGLNATLLYNQIGRRLYYVGQNSLAIGGAPDIYEAPRPLLDLQVSKKVLGTKGELKLNISDIINRKQYFYQNADGKVSFEKGRDAFRFTRRLGTSIGATFTYSL